MKYTKEMLESAVRQSTSVANVLRLLQIKPTGGSHSHISKMIKHYKINVSHFTGRGWNKGISSNKRKTPSSIFSTNSEKRVKSNQLTRALIESGVHYKCMNCHNNGEWNHKRLVLHVDHIDGNYRNNSQSNLRFLCPNCHSQTETYGSRNKMPQMQKSDAPVL